MSKHLDLPCKGTELYFQLWEGRRHPVCNWRSGEKASADLNLRSFRTSHNSGFQEFQVFSELRFLMQGINLEVTQSQVLSSRAQFSFLWAHYSIIWDQFQPHWPRFFPLKTAVTLTTFLKGKDKRSNMTAQSTLGQLLLDTAFLLLHLPRSRFFRLKLFVFFKLRLGRELKSLDSSSETLTLPISQTFGIFSMLRISSALSKLGFVIEFPDPNI